MDEPLALDEMRLLMEVGLVAVSAGYLRRAQRIFQGLIHLAPKRAFGAIGLGLTYLAAGRAADAVGVLKDWEQFQNPQERWDAAAFYGLALQKAQQASKGRQVLQRVIQADGVADSSKHLASRLLGPSVGQER